MDPMQTPPIPMGPGPGAGGPPPGPMGPPDGIPEGAGMPPPQMGPPDESMYDTRPTMDEVGYDWAQCCSVCVHFMPPEGCELVNGHIRCDGICSLFEERPGLPTPMGDEYDMYSAPGDTMGPGPMGAGPAGMPTGPTPTGPGPQGPPPGPGY